MFKKLQDQLFSQLQKLGKALMLPVAVLPAAGLLLGIGAAHFSWMPLSISQIMEQAGGAIFTQLPLIFAVGAALGSTQNDGVSALAAVVGFAVLIASMGVTAKIIGVETKLIMGVASIDTGVFGGILIGMISGFLFNRYYRIELPSYLGFFGGKRFVPIVTTFAAIFTGVVLAFVWPPLGQGIRAASDFASKESPALAFSIYGLVERSLIPFGLHHIWNVPFFFEVGSYIHPQTGEVVRGEIHRYLAGDPTAGNMAGGYLFKMFGLPAAAMAIWQSTLPQNRAKVGSIMISGALTSFLTGITEPIEFTFLFVAPILYFIHALLCSAAYLLTILFGIKHGMTFSHGFIDFILLFPKSTHGLWLWVIGPLWGLLYYGVFRFAILKFNLRTPGREQENEKIKSTKEDSGFVSSLITAFGGTENILSIDACITRLRIHVRETLLVQEDNLKKLGASGVMIVGKSVQAIFGTRSENIKTQIEIWLKNHPSSVIHQKTHSSSRQQSQIEQWIKTLGGVQNIKCVEGVAGNRLRFELKNKPTINEGELTKSGVKAIMHLPDNRLHLIVDQEASLLADQLKEMIRNTPSLSHSS